MAPSPAPASGSRITAAIDTAAAASPAIASQAAALAGSLLAIDSSITDK